MPFIPSMILRRLYNTSSLSNGAEGVTFSLRNRLSTATIEEVTSLTIDGGAIDLDKVEVETQNKRFSLSVINPETPLPFPKDAFCRFYLRIDPLGEGTHHIELALKTSPYGKLKLNVQDEIADVEQDSLPRDDEDDYSEDVIKARQRFIEKTCDMKLEHVSQYSFDAHHTRGNMEHFTGVAQVPLGFAGPLLVNGEHAQGEFYIPLAATEGTLVASYNRGMKLLNLCGGAKCAVVGDNMQRAPVFGFEDAAAARRFADWVVANLDSIRTAAEATDKFVRLKYVDYYLSNKFAYLRFNYTTGDAAGQNMVSKATFAACNWIVEHYGSPIQNFYLESNLATDKKASMINIMRSRGKRVTAEAWIKREALKEVTGADTESLYRHSHIANIGCMLSGANNNGLHSANAIAAMFLACGQDVADVSESSAALLYTELNEDKDLYLSVTLPSLIVATCGGGTALPTQRECLETLGCAGPGKVHKFAEIVAGTVLAGELSLAAAISADDWVSSHDKMGRN
jgi:hydroxymethylglutaryl-CoA reductase (NADPH)